MIFKKRKIFFLIIFILIICISTTINAIDNTSLEITNLTNNNINSNIVNSYVIDNSGIFSLDTKQQLNDALKQFEKDSNGVQIIVYIEDYIPQGTTLEERSLNIADVNKVGQKEKDNGILFYLATKDRQFRWEIGYGLEPTLNAAWLGRMSREYIIPKFANNNFEEGIVDGLIQVEEKILDVNFSNLDNFNASWAINNSNASIFLLIIFFLIDNPLFILVIIFLIVNIIKYILRKKNPTNMSDSYFNNAASGIFFGGKGGFGGSFSGGFSGGGGSFGGGGFSGKF
jgi:uncharacterized protein